jgi:hypothetical protein
VKVSLVFVPCVIPPSLLAWKFICNGIHMKSLMLSSVMCIVHGIFIIAYCLHTSCCCTFVV